MADKPADETRDDAANKPTDALRGDCELRSGASSAESPLVSSRVTRLRSWLASRSPKGEGWWALQDLNLRPTDYESAALTAELRALERNCLRF